MYLNFQLHYVYEVYVPSNCIGTVSSVRGLCTHLLYRHGLQCTRYVYPLIVPAQSLVYEVCVPIYRTGTVSNSLQCTRNVYLLIVPDSLQCTRYMYPLIVLALSLVYVYPIFVPERSPECEVYVPTYCNGTISSVRGVCTYLLYRHNLQYTRYVYLLIVPVQSLVCKVCVRTYLLYRHSLYCTRYICTHL